MQGHVAVKDVGNVPILLGNSLLSTTRLWWRPASLVTPTELTAFMRRMAYDGYAQEARANVILLVDQIRKACARGELPETPVVRMNLDEGKTLSATELVELMEKLPMTRRRALLWSLEMGKDLEQATTLTWQLWWTIRNAASPLAKWIVSVQPRHLQSDFVFWEFGDSFRPVPLAGLRPAVQRTTRWEYQELLGAYRRIIPL